MYIRFTYMGACVMDVSAISDNSMEIQSILLNGTKVQNRTNNAYDTKTQTAEYAKKGEPMYMAEMDSDEDGVVSLDEFRDYCKSKGIGTKKMIQMSQMASTYRTMQAENQTIDYISKLIPNIGPKVKQADSNQSQTNNKFNISNDPNNDQKVSYKEYMAYCEQNTNPIELKSNIKTEEADDGSLKITNSGKSINSYLKHEKDSLLNTFETEV